VISDFYHVQQGAQEPQLARLGPAGSDATLVTLGVGGNDIGFKTVAETCTKASILIFQRNSAYRENCRNVLDGNGALSKRIDSLMTGIKEPPDNQPYSLPQLYNDTRARAPGSRVYAIGYPRLLPASLSQDCGGQIKRENGSGVTFGPFHADFSIARQDAEWMNKLIAHLNSVISLAALNASFYYLDTQDALSGHDICGRQPWAYGPTLQNSNDNVSSFSYHPNANGQGAMADRVAKKIGSSDSTIVVLSQQSVTQTIPVAPGLMKLGVQSSWFGSDVELSLVSPSGRVYERKMQRSGVIHHALKNGESFAFDNPEPGRWTVRLFGANVPPAGEPVRLDVTQIPRSALAPIAVIDASRDRGVIPKTIQFDSHSSSAFGGSTIANYQWNFGDGSAPAGGSTVSHVFRTAGLHTVSLTATDSAGLSDTAHQDVFVSATNQPPSAQFVWGRPEPLKPLAVLMDASTSSDVDGSIVAYSWDFGDGSTGTGIGPSHSYSRPGKYPVILTVTDDGGLRASTCQLITAGSPMPSSPEPCNAPGLPKSGSSFPASAAGVASSSRPDPIPLPLAIVVVAVGDRLRRAIMKRDRAQTSLHR
jgi:PKD repeat protein/lysophospholipase L1-like esterase